MTAKNILGNRPNHSGRPRVLDASPTGSPAALPLEAQQLDRLAAGIVADATHLPRELLERFDTQQQGE